MSGEKNTFTRTFELETRKNVLTLHQQKIGDVSCVVWDAALVLAKYLDLCCQDNRFGGDWLRGKNVVELGAGVGCVGMTAACLGAHVIVTDLESTLPMLLRNIELNENQWKIGGGTARAKVLDWCNEIPSDFSPDIIVLADCVYYAESIQPLLKTLQILCERNPEAYAILSQEERDTPDQIPVWKEFMSELNEKFKIERIPLSEQHPTYSSEDIHLMKLTPLRTYFF